MQYPKRKWQYSDDHNLKSYLLQGMAICDISPLISRGEQAITTRINLYRKAGEFVNLPQLPSRAWMEYDTEHIQTVLLNHNMFHTGVFNGRVVALIRKDTGRKESMIIRKIFEINKVHYRDAGRTLSTCMDAYISYLTRMVVSLTKKLENTDRVSNTVQTEDTQVIPISPNIQ